MQNAERHSRDVTARYLLDRRTQHGERRADLLSSMHVFNAVKQFDFTVFYCLQCRVQHLTKTAVTARHELRTQLTVR